MKIKRPFDELMFQGVGYVVVGFFAVMCIIPFMMIISSSMTSETYILRNGYTLIPRDFSIEGYKLIFMAPMTMVRAYGITIFVTVVGTVIGVFIAAMTGYVLQRPDFTWRNPVSFFIFFTTLFNGGLVPWYILITQYLHMKNSVWALIIPSTISVWNILLAKGFIRSIPYAITESAKIDGCGDFKIFMLLIMPLSKPVIATIGLFTALGYWNDWFHAMLFITDKNLYPLQYYLYKLLGDIQEMRRIMEEAGLYFPSFPVESMKMALTVVVTGPIIFLYPFVQKYFIQGLTIGSVKG